MNRSRRRIPKSSPRVQVKKQGAFLVPTIGFAEAAVEDAPNEAARQFRDAQRQSLRKMVGLAHKLGVKIASGFDASTARDQGRNALEVVALHRAGLPHSAVCHVVTLAEPYTLCCPAPPT